MIKKTGQITIGLGVMLAAMSMSIGGVTGYFSSSAVVSGKISADRERIATLEANSENLKEWLVRIEKKLDDVIGNK